MHQFPSNINWVAQRMSYCSYPLLESFCSKWTVAFLRPGWEETKHLPLLWLFRVLKDQQEIIFFFSRWFARVFLNLCICTLFSLSEAINQLYLLLFKPYDTRLLNIYNKSECKLAYDHIRGEVEGGIVELLDLRERDQYKSFWYRFTYERFNGKQAPTAALSKWLTSKCTAA